MGPKAPRSTVLSPSWPSASTLLPLDDCLYALQATVPYLTRSSLHRCLKVRTGEGKLYPVACKRSRDFARTWLTPAAFVPRFEIERYLEGLRDVEEVVILVPTPD